MTHNLSGFSKALSLAALTLAPAAAMQAAPDKGAAAQNGQQPNIIFFLVDDMGWQDTSVPFHDSITPLNERYRTPNMERLAERGVKFTEAYACPVSSPSRCSLMSGMNAARHRVTNWTLEWNKPNNDESSDVLEMPQWHYNGIQNAAVATPHDTVNATLITPLPELLRQAGYYTIHCGKGHYAAQTTSGAEPLNMGYDLNIGGGASGGPGSYLAANEYHNQRFGVPGMEKYAEKGLFLTEALTEAALEALEKPIDEGKPFYLYMSHYAIHDPFEPDDRYVANYRDADGKGNYDPLLGERLSTAEVNHAGLIEGMDKSLGDILDFLDERPEVAANTVILFMSDNGGHAIYPRQGVNWAANYPARAGKGSALQGGVHEPMIAYWPGVTEAGTVNDNRVMIEDFFPTILELGGVTDPQTVQTVDGVSFADLMRDPSIKRERPIVWHFPNIWVKGLSSDQGYGAFSSLLKGDYKLIHYWADGSNQLFNVSEDESESNDLAASRPELVESMLADLRQRLTDYDAQYPTRKDGKPLE